MYTDKERSIKLKDLGFKSGGIMTKEGLNVLGISLR